MAHSCPECGQWCHCCGDIDDCDVGDYYAVEHCTCCLSVDHDWDALDDWDDDDPDDEEEHVCAMCGKTDCWGECV